MNNKLLLCVVFFMQCSVMNTVYSSENDESLYPHYHEIRGDGKSLEFKTLPFTMWLKDSNNYYVQLEIETDRLKKDLQHEGDLSTPIKNNDIFLQLSLRATKEFNKLLVSNGHSEEQQREGIFKIFPPEEIYLEKEILEIFAHSYSELYSRSNAKNIYMKLIEVLDTGDGDYVKKMPKEYSFIVNKEQVSKIADAIKDIRVRARVQDESNDHWLKIHYGMSIGLIIILIACFLKFRSK